ncbi:hypothetical protein BaRGS_00030606 [Batillaria attramentaria]|uniref:Uncharacterized protein n=1 Tax=Batillaria attramentaria TaxID=370345 RepID=A0ABD0JSZ7_9CAEN
MWREEGWGVGGWMDEDVGFLSSSFGVWTKDVSTTNQPNQRRFSTQAFYLGLCPAVAAQGTEFLRVFSVNSLSMIISHAAATARDRVTPNMIC